MQKVFLPFDAKLPAKQQAQFTALVAAANRSGFTIRVALISSSYDLGAITSLWRQPRTYARFLAEELSYLYKGRLLIVMPNGFGFHWLKHPSTAEYALLDEGSDRAGKRGTARRGADGGAAARHRRRREDRRARTRQHAGAAQHARPDRDHRGVARRNRRGSAAAVRPPPAARTNSRVATEMIAVLGGTLAST